MKYLNGDEQQRIEELTPNFNAKNRAKRTTSTLLEKYGMWTTAKVHERVCANDLLNYYSELANELSDHSIDAIQQELRKMHLEVHPENPEERINNLLTQIYSQNEKKT